MTYRLPKSADVGKYQHAASLHQVILPLIKRSKKSENKNEILELIEELGDAVLEDLTKEEREAIKKFKEENTK